MNRVTKSSNHLAGWMDHFLVGLSKKFATNTEEETMEKEDVVEDKDQITTVAEINISDLPKITWNDETFYVKLGEKGADVLNEFGNTVTSVQGVHSVEEVDKKLNDNQVVIAAPEGQEEVQADSPFSDELNKVVAGIEDEVEQPAEEEMEVLSSDKTEEVKLTPQTESEEVSQDDDLLTEAIASGFDQLEARLAFVEDQFKTLSQEYARVKELVNVDTGSGNEEQKHFEEQARNTQQSIDDSKNHDLTTPQGRVELSQGHQTSEVAPVVETDAKVDDVEFPENKESDEDKLPPLDTRAPKEDEPEKTDDKEVKVEDKSEDKTDDEVELKKEPVVAALDVKDSKIFMKAICPECGEERLTKSASVDNLQGVYCGSCEAEYAVDLSTEEIFKYKG